MPPTQPASVDRSRSTPTRLLHDPVTPGAAELRTDRANHFEARRNVFQRLGDILTQETQGADAVQTAVLDGFQGLGFPWQLRGKRAAHGPGGNHGLGINRRFGPGQGCGGFQIFQLQFQLVDLLVQLLGTLPELHASQFQDQQLQVFDFCVTAGQCGVLFNDDGLFLDDQCLQRFSIECIQIR